MSDALIERVGISGNRLVDSLSSPLFHQDARAQMISKCVARLTSRVIHFRRGNRLAPVVTRQGYTLRKKYFILATTISHREMIIINCSQEKHF